MIEDEELRVIYQSTSQEHLQQLETGILELEKNPNDLSSLSELMREAHSLKGDSRILDLTDIEKLTHKVEDILGAINRQEITMTGDLSDRLYQTLDAITQLVEEATNDTPSNVDINALLEQLETVLNPSPQTQEDILEQDLELELEESFSETETQEDTQQASSLMIADEELHTLYQTSSQEHLQHLKQYLQDYAQQPENQSLVEKLLKEAENLKTDSIIVGLDAPERLSEALEDIFDQLLCQELVYSQELIDRVEYALGELEKLIDEALTGTLSGVNIDRSIAELKAEKWRNDNTASSNGVKSENSANHTPSHNGVSVNSENGVNQTSSGKQNKTYRIDTIRVQTQHLDSLMTQTGELTVTKIRIAHTANKIEELYGLWEDWKTQHKKSKYKPSEKQDQNLDRIEQLITQLRDTSQDNSTRLDMIASDLEEKIGTLRLLPLSTVFHLFPRMVRDLAREENKEVELIIEGGETTADKQVLEEIKDPLMHLIRNAVDHGLETPEEREAIGKPTTGKIWLRGYQTGSSIVIELADDGRGLDIQKIKQTAIKRGLHHPEELEAMSNAQLYSLILAPGFSTRSFITEVSGRGVGLDVVQTNVQRLKGNIQIDSQPNQGCKFKIQLGTTLSTANVLLVEIQNTTYGLPVEAIQTSFLVSPENIFTIEGRSTITLENQGISVARLSDLLELPEDNSTHHGKQLPCILFNIGEEKFGLFVDRLLDTEDVVMKPQSKILKRVRNVLGATILGTGEVCMILNPQDLLKSLQQRTTNVISTSNQKSQPLYQDNSKPVILLAEDSITVRTQEKRILEGAGYEVITAVDGLDGYNKLKTRPDINAIISDVQMPNLDGLTFAEKVRKEQDYSEIPFILVTSLASDEDKRRGAQAGANAYITKDKFNQELLLDTLKRLV